MRYLTIIALLFTVGIAFANAQEFPVAMSFSGTGSASSIDLKQPGASTSEQDVAGKGTLGGFTFRLIKASSLAPQPSASCTGLYFPLVGGAGILRFQDGSLLNVSVTGGGDCIDLVQMLAHCTYTLKISGGTGRFQNASGSLTLAETARPILADSTNNPVLFSEAGDLNGTITGISFEAWLRLEKQQ